jgi:hypothetical protein
LLALLFDAIYSFILLAILTHSFTELRNFQDAVKERSLRSHYFFLLHRSEVRYEMNLIKIATAYLLVYFGAYTMVIKAFRLAEFLLRVSEAVMVLLILSLVFHDDKKNKPFRIALGRNRIDSSMLKKLFHVFPERNYWDKYGFDGKSDVQLLVHDTLRRRKMSVRRLKQLVEIFPAVLDRVDFDGMTPFQLACQFSSVYVVRFLLCLDASYLNVRDEREDTALHLACRHGNHKVAEYLIENAPFLVTKTNVDGDLPIHLLWGAPGEWKDHVSSTQFLGVVWRILLACPEAVCRCDAFSVFSSQTLAPSTFDFKQFAVSAFQIGTSDGLRPGRGQIVDNAKRKRERRKKTSAGSVTSSFEAEKKDCIGIGF